MATQTAVTRQEQTTTTGGGFTYGHALTIVSGVLMIAALYMALSRTLICVGDVISGSSTSDSSSTPAGPVSVIRIARMGCSTGS